MAKRRLVTDGARMLRAFLDGPHLARGKMVESQSVPDFCEEHGIDRIRLQRFMDGSRHRMAVDFAEKIRGATGGLVPMEAWSIATGRSPDSHPPRSAV